MDCTRSIPGAKHSINQGTQLRSQRAMRDEVVRSIIPPGVGRKSSTPSRIAPYIIPRMWHTTFRQTLSQRPLNVENTPLFFQLPSHSCYPMKLTRTLKHTALHTKNTGSGSHARPSYRPSKFERIPTSHELSSERVRQSSTGYILASAGGVLSASWGKGPHCLF
jgi:hypothetical protein